MTIIAKTLKKIDKSKWLKHFYKYIKNVNEMQKTIVFNTTNSQITDNKLIAEEFSEHFKSIWNHRNFDFEKLDFEKNWCNVLKNCEISMNDVVKAINHFNVNKAEGITFIPNKVIKKCFNVSKFVFILFNAILIFQTIPTDLKISKITPLLKKGKNKSEINSYESVSV